MSKILTSPNLTHLYILSASVRLKMFMFSKNILMQLLSTVYFHKMIWRVVWRASLI